MFTFPEIASKHSNLKSSVSQSFTFLQKPVCSAAFRVHENTNLSLHVRTESLSLNGLDADVISPAERYRWLQLQHKRGERHGKKALLPNMSKTRIIAPEVIADSETGFNPQLQQTTALPSSELWNVLQRGDESVVRCPKVRKTTHSDFAEALSQTAVNLWLVRQFSCLNIACANFWFASSPKLLWLTEILHSASVVSLLVPDRVCSSPTASSLLGR